jgi:O-methyltransferase domain/Dimerisation domain
MQDGTQQPPPQAVLLQMLMGMWVSQIISAVAQLGVPDRLAAGAASADDLARDCGADRDALRRLLRAASTLGLVAVEGGGRVSLTPLGETLRSDAPGSLRDFVIAETATGHWLPWGRLADAVRRGGSIAGETLGVADAWEYYGAHEEERMCFARGMSNLSTLVSRDVARVYEPGDAKVIVDVGGSEGVLLRGLLERAPGARGVLFDRADVVENVKPVDRVEIVAGDFLESVTEGADMYLLKSILHDWPDDRCETILKNCHRAAAPGARLVVVEMLLPDEGPSPVTFMDMNMLVMLGGRERTASEYTALLGRCGWNVERVIPTGGMFSVIEARRA